MTERLKLTSERLVDVFEDLLICREDLKCKRKPAEYAYCSRKQQKDEGKTLEKMEPKKLCKSCRALYYVQMARNTWLDAVGPLDKRWDPVELVHKERVKDAEYTPSLDPSLRSENAGT